MNIHIALYKWKDPADSREIAEILADIAALAGKIPGILQIHAGVNTSPYGAGYTHVIMVRAENKAAIEAYKAHPNHIKAANRVELMEEHGIGVDFSTD